MRRYVILLVNLLFLGTLAWPQGTGVPCLLQGWQGPFSGTTDPRGHFEIVVLRTSDAVHAITGTLYERTTHRPIANWPVSIHFHCRDTLGPGTPVAIYVPGYQPKSASIEDLASSSGKPSHKTYDVGTVYLTPSPGFPPQIQPLSGVDFGDVQVGNTKTVTYRFTNTLGERITINAVGFGDRFYSQDPPAPAAAVFSVSRLTWAQTLSPGRTYSFRISFTPPRAGHYTPTNPLTVCVKTNTTNRHIHFQIPLSGNGTSAVPPPSGKVYALMNIPNLGVIKVIDVAAARVENEIQLRNFVPNPLSIVVSPDGRYGMVHVASGGYVLLFEIPSGREVAKLSDEMRTYPLPIPATPSASYFFTTTIPNGSPAYARRAGSMLFTPDGKYALAQLAGTGFQPVLQIYDLTAGTTRTVPLNIATTEPIPIVVTNDGKYALFNGYCTFCKQVELKVIELASGDIVRSVLLGLRMRVSLPFVVTSDGHYALVHVPSGAKVVILDLRTNQAREVPLTDQAGHPVILANPMPLVLAEQ